MSNTPRTDAIWLQWFGEPVDAMENEVAIRKWLYDPLCKIERDLATANAKVTELVAYISGQQAAWIKNERDAERYRWLRKHSWLDTAEWGAPSIVFGAGYEQTAPEALDAAIDAAIAAREKP